MSRYYGNDILVLPQDLIAFAWSAPMRELAAKVDLSDVGLKKQLVSLGVPLPPQGYWNKMNAGKPIPATPEPEARRPGQIGRFRIDDRFRKVVPVARPITAAGPFESKEIPEDLDELYAQELKAIGRVTVPKSLDRPHSGLVQLLSKEDKNRAKFAERGWGEPLFDSLVAKRQLRILNALFWAVTKRRHSGQAYEHDGTIHASALIGDTGVGIDISLVGKDPRRQSWQPLAVGLPLSTPLALTISPRFDGRASRRWQDDKEGQLEEKIAIIAASLIVAGESGFRNSLRETEEREEKKRLEAEKQRQEHLKALNQERLKNLIRSGDLLRQAQDIRILVERVRDAIVSGTSDIEPAELRPWEEWALEQADRIDPIKSGQFLSHLREPET
ncbi:hypothetical protein [Rhizobium sp. AP16]|uniref:hypothetical protein n=1 Tax=Rhizobium sp. AP16 TaxID=1144306 RepID=UPI00026ED236|nr:hypothetical protein [Rhizobium sp. AP16]EJK83515.1 hypothetical protein PMI03_03170 [Rhizobium sp. AP16]